MIRVIINQSGLLSMEIDDDLPLSSLQHVVFCERQFALIHVEQIWTENALTIAGKQLHERADLPGESFGDDIRIARSVTLKSKRLKLSGKADVVEFHRESDASGNTIWRPFPVEYKLGRPKNHRADEIQLASQAVCLEEMLNLDVPKGALFYGKTRRRKQVDFTKELRDLVDQAAMKCHQIFKDRITPKVTRDARCQNCSLLEICLPEITGTEKSSSFHISSLIQQLEPSKELL